MGEADGSLTFRPYRPEDVPFLHDSWGTSYFDGSFAKKSLTPDEFHRFHRPIRERFFASPDSAVIVCSPDDDGWLIIGWIAVQRLPSGIIVQYLYVKSAFKKQGIAEQLIKRAVPCPHVFYTHLTDRASRIISKKQEQFRQWRHLPHLV